MKKILVVLIGMLFFSSACNKPESDNVKVSNGIITGRELTKCACCWGWLVEIDNVSYKFDRVPAGSPIDLENLTYPAPVNIVWRESQGSCGPTLIEVISISQ